MNDALAARTVTGDPVRTACALEDRGRHREAFRVLLRAARSGGDASAFVNLGIAYDHGRGVRRSKGKAAYWYRRAAERGDAAGAHNLATVFRDRGDLPRMVRWLRRAVALGDSGANLLDLLLQTRCCGETLWAFNGDHLRFLREFVAAKQRRRAVDPCVGWANRSVKSRLPRWMKAAAHRDEVLTAIDRLLETAVQAEAVP